MDISGHLATGVQDAAQHVKGTREVVIQRTTNGKVRLARNLQKAQCRYPPRQEEGDRHLHSLPYQTDQMPGHIRAYA